MQGDEHPDYSKACVRGHNGAIISLQRSPFFDDVLLSVGDWSCALWKEGQHESPLFTSPHAPAPYTAGCWSPTRPGPLPAINKLYALDLWACILSLNLGLDLHSQCHVLSQLDQFSSFLLSPGHVTMVLGDLAALPDH